MFVPRKVSAWIERILPASWVRKLKGIYTIYHRWQVTRINRRLLARLAPHRPACIQAGPFKGMVYVADGIRLATVSKWMGVYEMELHEVVETILLHPYATVVNIGCAEGYYAVGLARRIPTAKVYAFEAETAIGEQCRLLAQINGVASRVVVLGVCSAAQLEDSIKDETLIVCDCEGAEMQILDFTQAPSLQKADVLVELHDFLDPTISMTLLSRFERTHSVTLIDSRERDPAAYPLLRSLSWRDQRLALVEFRPGKMQWAYFQRKPSKSLSDLGTNHVELS